MPGVTFDEMVSAGRVGRERIPRDTFEFDRGCVHSGCLRRIVALALIERAVALRVHELRDICLNVPSPPLCPRRRSPVYPCHTDSTSDATLQALRGLMNASQLWGTELFECSYFELDALTSLMPASGVYGSRLTDAGGGGCTASLVPEEMVDGFIQKVKEGYGGSRLEHT